MGNQIGRGVFSIKSIIHIIAALFIATTAQAKTQDLTTLSWNSAQKYTDGTQLIVQNYVVEQSADQDFLGLTLMHEVKLNTEFIPTALIGDGANYFRIIAADSMGVMGQPSNGVKIDDTAGLPRLILGCSLNGVMTDLLLSRTKKLSYIRDEKLNNSAPLVIHASINSAACTSENESKLLLLGTEQGRRSITLMSQGGKSLLHITLPQGAKNILVNKVIAKSNALAVTFSRRNQVYAGLYGARGKSSLKRLATTGRPVKLSTGTDLKTGSWALITQAPLASTLLKIDSTGRHWMR